MKTTTITITTEELDTIAEINRNLKIVMAQNEQILTKLSDVPVIPPVEPENPTEIFDLDKFLQGKSGAIRLPKEFDGKEVVIKSTPYLKTNVTELIGYNTILTYESWDKTPTQIFDNSGSAQLGIIGIRFACPKNRPLVTGFPDKEIFGWDRDTVEKGLFAYIDVPEIKDKERVTFGLSRFTYSSKNETERIYLIAENVAHNGFNFCQIKNPYKGNLWLIAENVSIHNPIVELPRSHYYSPTRFRVKVKIENGKATIISDNSYDQILTHWGYKNGSINSIIHFDRYAFNINEGNLESNKVLRIDNGGTKEFEYRASNGSMFTNFEMHPGDITTLGIVIEKQVCLNAEYWEYKLDKKVEISGIALLIESNFNTESIQDAYIIHKGNAMFSSPSLTKDTKFGDGYWESGIITISDGYGWSWYCSPLSGWLKNFDGDGYFRNSSGGETQGLTLIDCEFEANPPIATANEKKPKEAQDYIDKLRKLQKQMK